MGGGSHPDGPTDVAFTRRRPRGAEEEEEDTGAPSRQSSRISSWPKIPFECRTRIRYGRDFCHMSMDLPPLPFDSEPTK